MQDKQTNAAPVPDNSIVTFLQYQRAGACMDELSAELRRLLGAVRETRKKGKITLEITVEPTAGQHVQVYDSIKSSVPVAPRECGVFYISDDGGLSRQDPRQREFNLQPVPGGQAAVLPVTTPAVAAVS